MSRLSRRHLYLPSRDRSFWQSPAETDCSLAYLAWGRRDFRGDHIPLAKHDGWVGVLIEEGNPVLILKDKQQRLLPGSFVLMGPNCAFGWESEGEGDCKFSMWMWLELDESTVGKLRSDFFWMRILERKEIQPYRQLHDVCRREIMSFTYQSPRYLDGCRMQFEVLLSRTLNQEPGKDPATVRIDQAVEWMQEHLDSREPVARLCDYLDVSQSSLHRLFTSRTGNSPASHFHSLKMDKARELLLPGDKQVKEVAILLGYEHFNDFSRAYKTYHGSKPIESIQAARK